MRGLVTRPEPGLSQTCERIAALGITPVKLPLFEALALEGDLTMVAASRPAAFIATSAAAIRAVGDAADRTVPLWAVGPATGDAARAAGFCNVIDGPGDAAGLAPMIVAARPAGDLLYLAGRVRGSLLETTLREAGLSVVAAEVYDMRPLDHAADELRHVLLQPSPVDLVLLYSSNAADRFGYIVAKAGLVGALAATPIVCLSEAVASRIPPEWRWRAVIADAPDEAAMMRRVAEIRNQAPQRAV